MYHKYKRLMFHKAYEILKNYTLAEDAVSEAFIRIFKNLQKIDDPDANKSIAFIMTIVKNVSLTMLQQEKKWGFEEVPETVSDNISLESDILAKLSAEEIIGKMETLSEELRSPFLLKYANQLSHKEIAGLLGITENNVTVRIHRAKQKLSEILRKEGYSNG